MNKNKKRLIVALLIAIAVFVAFKTGVVHAADPVGTNFCEEDSTKKVMSLIGYLLALVKLFVPLIIIILGSIDFAKAVIGKDEKVIQKQAINLGLRILLGICIFFLPSVISWALGSISDEASSGTTCMQCVLDPNNC